MSDKTTAIVNLLLLVALTCRNWQIMIKVSKLEEKVDEIAKGADDES